MTVTNHHLPDFDKIDTTLDSSIFHFSNNTESIYHYCPESDFRPDACEITGIETGGCGDTTSGGNTGVGADDTTKNNINKYNSGSDKFGSVRCWYTNATSLINKIDELKLIVQEKSIEIIFVTETWFCEGSSSKISGFNLFNKNRVSAGGGVAIYIMDSHDSIEIID